MPSSQAEINFIFLILYNRKDWNYTLSRIPPNKREIIRTLKGNIKKTEEFEVVPWVEIQERTA